jgi:formate dehydrogenase subunit gamma
MTTRITRWNRTERAHHWVHAAAFLVLLGSGLCLYLPSLAEVVNRRILLKHIHIYTALAWALVILLILAVGNRRSLASTIRELDKLDRKGRMNRGQQLNTIATIAFALLFGISGFLLWYGERDTRFRFASTVLVHDWLMYASLVPLPRTSLLRADPAFDETFAIGHDARLGARGLGREPPPRVGGGSPLQDRVTYLTVRMPFIPAVA